MKILKSKSSSTNHIYLGQIPLGPGMGNASVSKCGEYILEKNAKVEERDDNKRYRHLCVNCIRVFDVEVRNMSNEAKTSKKEDVVSSTS